MRGMRHRILYTGLAVALFAASTPRAGAASLQISPVIVDLGARDQAATVLLNNTSPTESMFGQVRVFKWDQGKGEDVLVPTEEMVASPPLIRIAPASSQLIRLVRTKAEALPDEGAYRVLIDEIATPGQTPQEGVTLRLRYSVPVFVNPAQAGAPTLRWRLQHDKAGAMQLQVTNSGSRRAQISAVTFVIDNRQVSFNPGLLGYALAGRSREWIVPPTPGVDLRRTSRVQALVNGAPIEAAIESGSTP